MVRFYLDGRRRFRKNIPVDGEWHHIAVIKKKVFFAVTN